MIIPVSLSPQMFHQSNHTMSRDRQGGMSEETRVMLNAIKTTEPPDHPYTTPFPKDASIYSYRFVKEGTGIWELWSKELEDKPPIPKDADFNEIIVPTVDTVRYITLFDMLLTHQKATLFVGPTGTGKSVYLTVSCGDSL